MAHESWALGEWEPRLVAHHGGVWHTFAVHVGLRADDKACVGRPVIVPLVGPPSDCSNKSRASRWVAHVRYCLSGLFRRTIHAGILGQCRPSAYTVVL